MSHKNNDFIKGMGAGVITGLMVAAAGKAMLSGGKKSFTKTAGKTMRAVGNIAEGINFMLKYFTRNSKYSVEEIRRSICLT